jgi:hypothetical protein
MAPTMRAGDVTLHDLSARFGLQLVKDATFFLEWHAELLEISEQEKQQLDRIQASYLHLVSQTSYGTRRSEDGGLVTAALPAGRLRLATSPNTSHRRQDPIGLPAPGPRAPVRHEYLAPLDRQERYDGLVHL